MKETVRVKRHVDLSVAEFDLLEKLFDSEYLSDYGPWDPHAPYGYSPADFHVLLFLGSELSAHVGFQRRVIKVGTHDVVVAGTGGVLVDKRSRGTGLGGKVMRHAQESMRDQAQADFGFLGCRPEVVSFYESAGWIQIHATERCVSRMDQTSVKVSEGGPNLICPAKRAASEWPNGDIDLRGTPW
jgi:aminoglycoside 2'-N-acetyltransferase I